MADIKVIYKNADGFDNEHSESADSVKFFSFKTSAHELTDTKLGHLVDGADAADEHIHDARYFRENEFIDTTTGASDGGKPIKTGVGGFLNNSFIDVAGLNEVLSHSALLDLDADDHLQYLLTDGTRDITGVIAYSSHPSFGSNTQLVDKQYVDTAIENAEIGLDWMVADTRAVTPPTPTLNYKVLIDTALGSPSGAFVGHDNELATGTGTGWIFHAPEVGQFAVISDEPTAIYNYSGTAWVPKSFEATTASTGLVMVGNDIRIASSAAGSGLGFSSGVISVNVDNSSLEITTDTLNVKALGIKDSMIDFGTGTGQVSASDIPIADAGGFFPTDTVEAALQKLALDIVAAGVEYTVGTGGVTKGDLVYVTGNDTVNTLSTLTVGKACVGIAMTTASSGATVKVLANDTLLASVSSGMTAGERYYWTGSAYSLTMPSTSGHNVWAVGVAKNATDLAVEVAHVKKNA